MRSRGRLLWPGRACAAAALCLGLLAAQLPARAVEAGAAQALDAWQRCDLQRLRLALWDLSPEDAGELLGLLGEALEREPRLAAAAFARIGGRAAAAVGLALLRDLPQDAELRLLQGELELARSDRRRALGHYRAAHSGLGADAPAELLYHVSRRLTELYVSSTPSVERASSHLRVAIGMAYRLERHADLEHLQELQHLYALQLARLKERPDALRLRPLPAYRGLVGAEARELLWDGSRLWVLGDGGAALFDGVLWRAYPSELPFGWTAALGSDGALYAAPLLGGLARLRDGRWQVLDAPRGYEQNPVLALLERSGWLYLAGGPRLARMPLGGGALEPMELPTSEPLLQVAELGGRLLLVSARGLWSGEGDAWQPLEVPGLPAEARLRSVSVLGDGLWLATDRGVFLWQAGRLAHHTAADGLPTNNVERLRRTVDGSVYAAAPVAGMLAVLDGEAWRSASDPVAALDVEHTPGGLLVAATEGLFHGRSPRWRILDSRTGLLGDALEYALRLGDEIWLLAQGAGVMRLASEATELYDTRDGLPPLATYFAMAREGQRRWLATDHGLFVLEAGRFVRAPLREALPSEQIFALHPAGPGELFAGTTEGLVVLDAAGRLQPVRMPSPVARAIAALGDGRHLVATEGAGLVVLARGESGRPVLERAWSAADGLCSDQAQALLVEADTLWVGTNRGLVRAARGADRHGGWTCLGRADGLPGEDVTALARLGSGLLAVAFYGTGIGLYDGETWSLFDAADGLPSTAVWSVLEREPGLLWAGTSRGLWELRLEAPAPETFVELGGSLYRAGAARDTCRIGETPLEAPAAAQPSLRVGQRDFRPLGPGVDPTCPDGEPAAPLKLDAVPRLGVLGQEPWSFEDPDTLWYSVQLDEEPPGAFVRAAALALPEMSDGRHRLRIRAKSRLLGQDPTPVLLEIELDRPLPAWLLAALAGSGAALLLLARTRIYTLALRLRHLRYRPIEHNPYRPRQPAQGSLFVGRDAALRRWLGPTARPEAGSESLVLFGQPGIGKTSALAELQRRADEAGARVLRFDLADWADADLDTFLTAVHERLDAVITASEDGPPQGASPMGRIDGALLRIGAEQPARRILWLIDDAQLLEGLAARGGSDLAALARSLRGLLQRHRRLGLVLALGGAPEALRRTYGELLFFSTAERLEALPEEATALLCSRPSAGLLSFTPRAVQRIHRLTGGHPALLQLALHALVERMAAARRNVCRLAQVEGALPELLRRAALLERWWQGLPRPQQLVLALAAEKLEPDERLDIEAFCVAKSERLGLLPPEIRRAIGASLEAGLLDGDERHAAFSSELAQRWIRAERPFRRVFERELLQLGPYELLSKIGQGGMGTVYRARRVTGAEIVAVKVLHAAVVEDDESRHRFFREADIGIRLRHDNIVAIHEHGEHAGQAYLVMELLEGVSLRGHLQQKGPMAATKAMKLLRGIAGALGAIHELGVVHRDVKTENVFLCIPPGTKKAVPKLMDFGLARSETSRVTRSGVLVGTIAYMSPEQALGERLGPASDLYSLGVVLFEMLSGRVPFSGASDVAILSQIVHRAPPDLRPLRPDVHEDLLALLEQLLAKDPAKRPASAGEVVRRLDALLDAAQRA
jgi:ligand-binding sensor domain-containing protein